MFKQWEIWKIHTKIHKDWQTDKYITVLEKWKYKLIPELKRVF